MSEDFTAKVADVCTLFEEYLRREDRLRALATADRLGDERLHELAKVSGARSALDQALVLLGVWSK